MNPNLKSIRALVDSQSHIAIELITGEVFTTLVRSLDANGDWLSIRPTRYRRDGGEYPGNAGRLFVINTAHIVWIEEV